MLLWTQFDGGMSYLERQREVDRSGCVVFFLQPVRVSTVDVCCVALFEVSGGRGQVVSSLTGRCWGVRTHRYSTVSASERERVSPQSTLILQWLAFCEKGLHSFFFVFSFTSQVADPSLSLPALSCRAAGLEVIEENNPVWPV